MKKYLAIGHWAENKNATFSVAMRCTTAADFRSQLAGNEFIPDARSYELGNKKTYKIRSRKDAGGGLYSREEITECYI